MGVISRVNKPTTRKGKKILLKKEPQVIEDAKQTLIMRGRKTNDILMSCIRDLYAYKKPDAQLITKRKDILPFENHYPLESFSRKFNSPLFMFATTNKKRPNSIIFGRTYDHQLLDMIELGVVNYKSMRSFATEGVMAGIKPCLSFSGDAFESKPELKRLKNLFIDMFHREAVDSIRLQGIEHVLSFAATDDGSVYFRSYRIFLKKTGAEAPRVELTEIGPSIDFTLRRTKLASDDLYKTACKQPKELKAVKNKNIRTNVFGTKEARIHVTKQNTSRIQTRKMKGLKKSAKERKEIRKSRGG